MPARHHVQGEKSKRVFRLNWVLVAVFVAGCLAAWPLLPAEIPLHFGLDGTPDEWQAKDGGVWFTLPVLCAVLAFVMTRVPKVAATDPGSWNVKNRRLLVSLSTSQREPIVHELEESVAWMAVFVTTVFFVLQGEVFAAARGHHSPVQWVFYGFIGIIMAIALYRCHLTARAAKHLLENIEANQAASRMAPLPITRRTSFSRKTSGP